MADMFGCEPTSSPPTAYDFMKALFTNAWTRINSRGKTAQPKIEKLAEVGRQTMEIMKNKTASKEERLDATRRYVAAIKDKHCLERPFATSARAEQMEVEVKEIKGIITAMRGEGKSEYKTLPL